MRKFPTIAVSLLLISSAGAQVSDTGSAESPTMAQMEQQLQMMRQQMDRMHATTDSAGRQRMMQQMIRHMEMQRFVAGDEDLRLS